MANSDREFLKECAYESAKDDYENLPMLVKEVEAWAQEEGRPWAEREFMDVLQELIEAGKMVAYRYAADKQAYVPVKFDREHTEDVWFRSRRGS